MEEKSKSVINVRLPADMKEKLKQKLGYNMSGIMKEHFQKLLDVKEFELQNKCFLCKQQHNFDECSYVSVKNEDGSDSCYIFCKDCMKNPNLKAFNKEEKELIELFIVEARDQKHPEYLEALSKIAHEHNSLCEARDGILCFSKGFNAYIEELKRTTTQSGAGN